MLPGEVDQFALDLRRHEPHQAPRRIGHRVTEGPIQPHGGVLGDVIRVIPSANLGELAQEPAGQLPEPVVADFQNVFTGGIVALGQPFQTAGKNFVKVAVGRHRFTGIS